MFSRTTSMPRVLQITPSGVPQRWISIKDAVCYYATDKVLFDLGGAIAQYRGGINRKTNKQSIIVTKSIISIRGKDSDEHLFSRTPKLTNKFLFERDRHICVYCGHEFPTYKLSRDHIIPKIYGGKNTWTNVATSCKVCNCKKGGRTPEEAGMELLYLPYTPDRYETFIFAQSGRKILHDQMEYLISKVNKKSRLLQEI